MKDVLRIAFLSVVGIVIARNAVLPLIGAVDTVSHTLTRSIR